MRRIACIALPAIRLEIARENAGPARSKRADPNENAGPARSKRADPIVVVVARKGGAVRTERDVLGSTRLDVVSCEAYACGIRAGQTVAAARAKHAVRVRVVEEDAVRGALTRVAEVALAFGPTVSFDESADVVWVDVGGCAHLHGGEAELARAVEARVLALGHVCRVAVADGPRIAAAMACFAGAKRADPNDDTGAARSKRADPNDDTGAARSKRADPNDAGPWIVPPGQGAAALGELPIAALGLDEGAVRWLLALGLPRCRDLQALPRRSLGTRLGARAHDVMKLLGGEDGEPLVAWRPPPVPEERVELEWGASSMEALVFVLKGMCDRLAARLCGRAMAAARLEVVLGLDRALCQGGVAVSTFTALLPSPLARAADLLAVVRARLEQHTLAAPVLAVTLRAPELAPSTGTTGSLFEPEPKADRALPRLVAELAAELGTARVGVLALVDTWAPDERTRLVSSAGGGPRHALVTSAIEPSRIVEPSAVALEALGSIRPLVRVEAVHWWRRRPVNPSEAADGAQTRVPPRSSETKDRPWMREFAAAWLNPTARVDGALAWVELREEDALVRGWLD
jgi:protein ImuB